MKTKNTFKAKNGGLKTGMANGGSIEGDPTKKATLIPEVAIYRKRPIKITSQALQEPTDPKLFNPADISSITKYNSKYQPWENNVNGSLAGTPEVKGKYFEFRMNDGSFRNISHNNIKKYYKGDLSHLKQMKKGGIVNKKKFADGGGYQLPNAIQGKIPEMGTAIPGINSEAEATQMKKSPANVTNPTALLSGMATQATDAGFDAAKYNVASGMDLRDNPAEAMKKMNNLDTGKALAKGAATGAALGSVVPVIGTAVGAALGTVTAGIARIAGSKKRKDEMIAATQKWSSGHTAANKNYMASTSYKKGGVIKGKGTAKSDSIDMKAPDGSFIVPAENAQRGHELGKSYLGWTDKSIADRNNGGTGIKVSNGEVLYTPEEVGVLKYYGINLDELAPNANPGNKMAPGGIVEDPSLYMTSKGISRPSFATPTYGLKSGLGENLGDSSFSPFGIKTPEEQKKAEDPNKRNGWDMVPEIAGAIQIAGGAAGLIKAGKKPDITISKSLQQLSRETKKLSQFGYEPAVLNGLNNQIEKARRDVNTSLKNKGGSPQEVMAKLQETLGTVIDKKAGIMFADAAEKSKKFADYLKVKSDIAGQEFDISKINLDEYYKNQEVYANLLSAGISNIVGARKLKSSQDNLLQIAKEGKVSISKAT